MKKTISLITTLLVGFSPLAADSSLESILNDVKENIITGEAPVKDELCAFVDELSENRVVRRSASQEGGDAAVRPVFVTLQGEIEKELAYRFATGDVVDVLGIIHTPTPATPLCTEGEISEGLVDEALEQDLKRVYTVQTRAGIMRDYLAKGGKLMAVYPLEGRNKRSDTQLAVFDGLKEQYPKDLIDSPLTKELRSDMVGAIYIFATKSGEMGVFSIKAYQANAPEDTKEWAIWYGSVNDAVINERYMDVLVYLTLNGASFDKL